MEHETKSHAPMGRDNRAFEDDVPHVKRNNVVFEDVSPDDSSSTFVQTPPTRATWSNSVEFLMSCIALSIGFGNVWRFPFTAYENGGGAFLIPYVIVLFLVGKPFYYLEMIVGQFSSSSCVNAWSLSPAFRGIGWAQMCSMVVLSTYYCSLMALTLFYLIASFSNNLPWATCREEWGDNCVDSGVSNSNSTSTSTTTAKKSSAELYFVKEVLKETETIDDGIGLPDWRLTLCLLGSWVCVFLVLSRGVKSSGKAAYFLAIFPYVVMISLLVRAVTLEGAVDGIIFFVTPNWGKLLDPSVWYAAITQCFFSLSVCFGSIIMYSSHNEFRHNVYRDAMIVTTLDTFTSMMAGCTIFGILGNLAHELGNEDISTVVRGGTGLAFISYPDAIAKFTFYPQLFAVLFFVMMFVLGVGSAAGLTSGLICGVCDQFPNLKYWQVVIPTCLFGFSIGTIYVTPGGQFILSLVDYYGASFVVFILATFEMTGIMWVYGLENFLDDVEFMMKKKPSIYWRICWCVITPLLLITILIYTLIKMTPLSYNGVEYPASAHAAGWTLLAFGVLQIPVWMAVMILKNRGLPVKLMIQTAFRPSRAWGPQLSHHRQYWLEFKKERAELRKLRTQSRLMQNICVLLHIEPK